MRGILFSFLVVYIVYGFYSGYDLTQWNENTLISAGLVFGFGVVIWLIAKYLEPKN